MLETDGVPHPHPPRSGARICPTCQLGFAESMGYCPTDGAKLLVLTQARASERIGRVLDGKLELTALLGEGGMGSVYQAHQLSMGREVAVKILHASYSADEGVVRRFLREARAASTLDHPAVITLYDFGQSDAGELFLVMELLRGENLAEILDRDGRLGVRRAVALVSQVCGAAAHAHQHGVVHRDLKPENVLVLPASPDGEESVKVLDFGVAKVRSIDGVASLTATGFICGTPAYMSPEQARGLEVDGRSDVYALGILLFECLTGQLPFEGETPLDIMMAHVQQAPRALAEACPEAGDFPALEAVVRRCLAKRPRDRYADAGALDEALKRALADTDPKRALRQTAPSRPALVSTPPGWEWTEDGDPPVSTAHVIASVHGPRSRRRRVAVTAALLVTAGLVWTGLETAPLHALAAWAPASVATVPPPVERPPPRAQEVAVRQPRMGLGLVSAPVSTRARSKRRGKRGRTGRPPMLAMAPTPAASIDPPATRVALPPKPTAAAPDPARAREAGLRATARLSTAVAHLKGGRPYEACRVVSSLRKADISPGVARAYQQLKQRCARTQPPPPPRPTSATSVSTNATEPARGARATELLSAIRVFERGDAASACRRIRALPGAAMRPAMRASHARFLAACARANR